MGKLDKTQVQEVQPTPVENNGRMLITIPLEDLYEHLHPGVQLIGGAPKVWKDDKYVATGEGGNSFKFEAGKTYSVPVEVGKEIQRRLDGFARAQRRLNNPRADRTSLREVTQGSQWTVGGGGQLMAMDNGYDSVASANEQVIVVDI